MPLPSTLANLAPPTEATLLRRIEDIERTQRETLPAMMAAIGPTIADLQDAQADLAAQQAALAVEVARIDALVGAQVSIAAVGVSQTGINIPGSSTLLTSTTISIPGGFTRAIVHVTANVGAYNGSAGGVYLIASGYINGTTGGEQSSLVSNGTLDSVSVSAIRSLTGLTGGGTITVGVQGRGGLGTNGSNIANVDAIAVFLR